MHDLSRAVAQRQMWRETVGAALASVPPSAEGEQLKPADLLPYLSTEVGRKPEDLEPYFPGRTREEIEMALEALVTSGVVVPYQHLLEAKSHYLKVARPN